MRLSTAGLRFDVVAGLTAAAVVLPKAMAYATVAGLPVAVGLATSFVPMIVDERLGRERMLFNARAAIARYQTLQASARGDAQPAPS